MPTARVSLYESLTGQFSNGLAVDQVEESEQLLLSVLGTLQRVFASRQGAVAHLPGFGLPDLGLLLDAQPAAQQGVCRALCEAVQLAEPRILKAQARLLPQRLAGHFRAELALELVGGQCHVTSVALGPHLQAMGAALYDQDALGPAGLLE